MKRFHVSDFVRNRLVGLQCVGAVPSGDATNVFIGTHSGNFHCDEAMACGILRHTKQFSHAHVCRTRDPSTLKQCACVVDVGAVYAPSALKFDHHQKEFQDTMDTGVAKYKTRLSSAGLIYRHYGREVLQLYADLCFEQGALAQRVLPGDLDLLFDKVYKGFVEHVDGVDNGVEEYSLPDLSSITAHHHRAEGPKDEATQSTKPPQLELVRNYIVPTTLSRRVGSLFPRWTEPSTTEDENRAFVDAVHLATTEFFEAVDYYMCSWLPGRRIVHQAFEDRAKVHASKSIVSLPTGGCPWKEHLFDIERAQGATGQTLFILFPESAAKSDGAWRVQAVPKENSGFSNRKDLLWKGLRDDALSVASGIPGGIFVHASGFIGGNASYNGALQMAIQSCFSASL